MNEPRKLLTPVAGFNIGDVVVDNDEYPPMTIQLFAGPVGKPSTLAMGYWDDDAGKKFTRVVDIKSMALLSKSPDFDTNRPTYPVNGGYVPRWMQAAA